MTCPPWPHGLSACGEGRRAHYEAESSLTCDENTFMFITCQETGPPLFPSPPSPSPPLFLFLPARADARHFTALSSRGMSATRPSRAGMLLPSVIVAGYAGFYRGLVAALASPHSSFARTRFDWAPRPTTTDAAHDDFVAASGRLLHAPWIGSLGQLETQVLAPKLWRVNFSTITLWL